MKKTKVSLIMGMFGATALIAACGGGGGGGAAPDTTPPAIVSTNPAAGATSGQTRAVAVTFNEPVKSATVSSGTFTVTRGGAKLAGTVSASGATATFSPVEGLCLFSDHTATVMTGITDLAGNALASNYTWTFTTGDGTWDNALVTVDTSTTHGVISPHADMDDSGNAIAVWLQDDGAGIGGVWASRFIPGNGWSAPVQIDSKTNVMGRFSMDSPQVAVNGSGNAVAVWQEGQPLQQGGTLFSIWASRYNAASGQWSTAQLLETNDVDAAYTPDVGIDSSGNAVAVWVYSVPGGFNPTYAAIYTAAATTWSAPVNITTAGGVINNSSVPKIAVNGSGKAIVVGSTEVSNVGFRVWAVRHDGTSWGGVTMIDGVIGAGGGQYGPVPQVSMNYAGDAFVVWNHQANGSVRIEGWANQYSGGSWGTASKIRAIDPNTNNSFSEAQVAVDPQGNAMVVWAEVNAPEEIFVKRYVAGTGWETNVTVLDDTTKGYDMHPQIAVDNIGNALVVWSDQGKAYAKRYVKGMGWGSTITTLEMNSNTANMENSPIAMNKACGNAIAVWLGDRNFNFGIQSSRFR